MGHEQHPAAARAAYAADNMASRRRCPGRNPLHAGAKVREALLQKIADGQQAGSMAGRRLDGNERSQRLGNARALAGDQGPQCFIPCRLRSRRTGYHYCQHCQAARKHPPGRKKPRADHQTAPSKVSLARMMPRQAEKLFC